MARRKRKKNLGGFGLNKKHYTEADLCDVRKLFEKEYPEELTPTIVRVAKWALKEGLLQHPTEEDLDKHLYRDMQKAWTNSTYVTRKGERCRDVYACPIIETTKDGKQKRTFGFFDALKKDMGEFHSRALLFRTGQVLGICRQLRKDGNNSKDMYPDMPLKQLSLNFDDILEKEDQEQHDDSVA